MGMVEEIQIDAIHDELLTQEFNWTIVENTRWEAMLRDKTRIGVCNLDGSIYYNDILVANGNKVFLEKFRKKVKNDLRVDLLTVLQERKKISYIY